MKLSSRQQTCRPGQGVIVGAPSPLLMGCRDGFKHRIVARQRAALASAVN